MALTACTPEGPGYDEDVFMTAALGVIEDINGGQFAEVFDAMAPVMQAQLPTDRLKATFDPILARVGDFEECADIRTRSMTQEGTDLVVVVASCEYDKETLVYTISFLTDMQLAGLFVR